MACRFEKCTCSSNLIVNTVGHASSGCDHEIDICTSLVESLRLNRVMTERDAVFIVSDMCLQAYRSLHRSEISSGH